MSKDWNPPADPTPQEQTQIKSWLTADQCVDKYGIDPIRQPTGQVRNKLHHINGGGMMRVWLEEDVISLKR